MQIESPNHDGVVLGSRETESLRMRNIQTQDNIGVSVVQFYVSCRQMHEFERLRVAAKKRVLIKRLENFYFNDFIQVETPRRNFDQFRR